MQKDKIFIENIGYILPNDIEIKVNGDVIRVYEKSNLFDVFLCECRLGSVHFQKILLNILKEINDKKKETL